MSDEDRWREVDALFDAALDLPPEEQAAFLDARCPAELRPRVEALLDGAGRIEGFLPAGAALQGRLADSVFDDLERGEGAPGDVRPGAMIGEYRLVARLGEGGMGEVWEAEQTGPVRRRVALKLLKLGMDSKRVLARFETERQALALMNHPNVAQVFGGGSTGSGRPYLVMELVPGSSVTAYAHRQGLSMAARLDLFLQVCDGVQHAHHKGVVHRDLKPSNILVAEAGGRAIPKIIDFGVARALDTRLTAETFLTEQGQILGTPEYMSPEQADPGTGDIDTRTDVYSLGVLLYELLAGVRPFDAEELKALGFLELLRRIRETEPPRPSQRADATQSRHLRGDLDWIVMKALEKERSRRYVSPHEMAEDVRRHLANQPVLAGPPSRSYRMRKLVRRHRGTVAAASLALTALVAVAAIAATQAVRATRAERSARAEAETARQVSDFLATLFEVSDPNVSRGDTVTARELLDRGAVRMNERLSGQPAVRARLQTVVGEIYRKLGLFEPATAQLEQAVKTREELLGTNDLETVRSLHALARLHGDRGDHGQAEAMFRSALTRLAQAPQPDRAEEARLLCELGNVVRATARHGEAEELQRKCLDGLTRELGASHLDVASAWGDLGNTLRLADKSAEAEAAFRQAIAIREAAQGPDHPQVAVTLQNLAGLLSRAGRGEEAETFFRRAIAIAEKAYGPDHPTVGGMLLGLGAVVGKDGRLDEAALLFARAVAIRERVFGPSHPETAQALMNLGLNDVLRGEWAQGRRTLERVLAINAKGMGPDHPATAWTRTRLGYMSLRLADLDGAEAAFRQALASTEKVLGPESREVVGVLRGLADVRLRRGRLEAADELLARALATAEKAPTAHPEIPATLNTLGELRTRQRRFDEAGAALERARSLQPPGHPSQAATSRRLGDLAAARRDLDSADAFFREAAALLEKAHGPDHPEVADALHRLATTLAGRGRAGEAAAFFERALRTRRRVMGAAHPDTRASAAALAALRPESGG